MRLDIVELNKLLNLFGISLKVEVDEVIITNNKNNEQLKISYYDYGRLVTDNDFKLVLNGWQFNADGDKINFELNIWYDDGMFEVFTVKKVEEKEPNIFEILDAGFGENNYSIQELTYNVERDNDGRIINRDCTYNKLFCVGDYTPNRNGYVEVWDGNRECSVSFLKDNVDEIAIPVVKCNKNMEMDEAMNLFNKSILAKDMMKHLYPEFAKLALNEETDKSRTR